MSQRRYLLAYDISDPYRLRQVAKVALGFGDRLQYSVFVCELTRSSRINLLSALHGVADFRVDRVILIDLGPVGSSMTADFEFYGPKWALRSRNTFIK